MSVARNIRARGEAGNVQAELREEIQRNASPLAGGVIVKGVEFTASIQREVAHTLGRPPVGWLVVRDYGSAAHSIREVIPPASPSRKLTLVSASTCTVDLMFF